MPSAIIAGKSTCPLINPTIMAAAKMAAATMSFAFTLRAIVHASLLAVLGNGGLPARYLVPARAPEQGWSMRRSTAAEPTGTVPMPLMMAPAITTGAPTPKSNEDAAPPAPRRPPTPIMPPWPTPTRTKTSRYGPCARPEVARKSDIRPMSCRKSLFSGRRDRPCRALVGVAWQTVTANNVGPAPHLPRAPLALTLGRTVDVHTERGCPCTRGLRLPLPRGSRWPSIP